MCEKNGRTQRKMFSKLLASGGITIAMLADASPIAMREWLVAEMYVIANSDLPLFYDTACKLVGSTWALIAGLDCDIDRKECDQILAKCVFHHMLPPMAMGSRATDIVHKLITILSMFSRDIGPWPTIQLIINSVISWTTDFGTESLFAPLWNMLKHLTLNHLEEIFPGGTHLVYSDDDNIDEAGGVGPLQVLENVCKSKMVFEIAGGLHQTNNTSKDLDEYLPWFTTWCEQANTLSSFLRQRWTKELFMAQCLNNDAANYWLGQVRTFSASLVEWRFGSAVHVAQDLTDLEPCILQFWDPRKLNMKTKHSAPRPIAKAKPTSIAADVAAATLVVRSRIFWAYTKVVLILFNILSHVSNWMESCACHPNALYRSGRDVFLEAFCCTSLHVRHFHKMKLDYVFK